MKDSSPILAVDASGTGGRGKPLGKVCVGAVLVQNCLRYINKANTHMGHWFYAYTVIHIVYEPLISLCMFPSTYHMKAQMARGKSHATTAATVRTEEQATHSRLTTAQQQNQLSLG